MKINLYKIDEGIKYDILIEKLIEDNYVLVKEKFIGQIKYSVLINSKDRKRIDWLDSIIKIFDIEDKLNEYGKIYNGILLISYPNGKIYGISFGHAFHQLHKVCDPNFALDFAESELRNNSIDMKSSIFVQNVKIKGLVNFKSGSITMNEGGESYKFVSGVPISDSVFGKKIECGFSIRFSKPFYLENDKSLNEISMLIKQVESAIMRKGKVNSFPRVRYISRNSLENERLDNLLLEKLKNDDIDFDINLSAFNILGNKIFFNGNEYGYRIYINNEKKLTVEELESLDVESIRAYIQKYSEKISKLDSIKIEFIKDGEKNEIRMFKEIIFAEVYNSDKKYILDNCLWGEFNQKFLDELENQLKYIAEKYLVLNPEHLSITYSDEDNYIESLVDTKDIIQLHKKFIYVGQTPLEVADLYIAKTKELISVKLGKANKDLIYSFDQAISSVNCIKNYKEYLLEERLIKIGVNKKVVDGIIKSSFNSVLLGLEQDTYKKKIIDKTFKLNDLKSLLLKLKIVAWAKYLGDANVNFKLYIIPGERISKEEVIRDEEKVS